MSRITHSTTDDSVGLVIGSDRLKKKKASTDLIPHRLVNLFWIGALRFGLSDYLG